jgi:hypothetical protein
MECSSVGTGLRRASLTIVAPLYRCRSALPTRRYRAPVAEARDDTITTVSEYAGQSRLRISATQLGTRYTASQAKRIVSAWVEFFAAGPTPIEDLEFVTRTPKRLFAALEGQTQLERLAVKWGDYDDLRVLAGMRRLVVLRLRGASSVRDLTPVARLTSVRDLEIESLRHARDLSAIGQLTHLQRLVVGGDWMSPRIAHVDSIAFLTNLSGLRRLLLHTVIVDDLDYTPVLALPALEAVRIMATRGMRPSIEELRTQLPWAENENP